MLASQMFQSSGGWKPSKFGYFLDWFVWRYKAHCWSSYFYLLHGHTMPYMRVYRILIWMVWFKGKSTENFHISWKNQWFPVDCTLNQIIQQLNAEALGRAGSKRAKEGGDGVAGEARAAATRARSVLPGVEPANPWRVGPANMSISPWTTVNYNGNWSGINNQCGDLVGIFWWTFWDNECQYLDYIVITSPECLRNDSQDRGNYPVYPDLFIQKNWVKGHSTTIDSIVIGRGSYIYRER